MPNRLSIILLGALIAACDGGPSDSEFEAACLAEGERNAANKAMRADAWAIMATSNGVQRVGTTHS